MVDQLLNAIEKHKLWKEQIIIIIIIIIIILVWKLKNDLSLNSYNLRETRRGVVSIRILKGFEIINLDCQWAWMLSSCLMELGKDDAFSCCELDMVLS